MTNTIERKQGEGPNVDFDAFREECVFGERPVFILGNPAAEAIIESRRALRVELQNWEEGQHVK